METQAYRLSQSRRRDGETVVMIFTLRNLAAEPLSDPRLILLRARPLKGTLDWRGARLVRWAGGEFEVQTAKRDVIGPGECWEFSVSGLKGEAGNRSDGVIKARLLADNAMDDRVAISALEPVAADDGSALRCEPVVDAMAPQFFMFPWPAKADVEISAGPTHYWMAGQISDLDRVAASRVKELHGRLYPGKTPVFVDAPGSVPVEIHRSDKIAAEGYSLVFEGERVRLEYADDAGRFHGLVSLSQISHGSCAGFAVPRAGEISDAPRYAWRGCLIDTVRAFQPEAHLLRLCDILAWSKMNRMHLHLTDDEAWRLETSIAPWLNSNGVQILADAAQYSRRTVSGIVRHAGRHFIEVMPELNMPAHNAHLLSAIPELNDPGEPAAAYRSFHGFANNTLNPAQPGTFELICRLLGEMSDIFPFELFHIGWDEIPHGAWECSPLAQAKMQSLGPDGAAGLSASFFRDIVAALRELGKVPAAWDDAADAACRPNDGALLFCWQSRQRIEDLLRRGYRVVATPREHYYLDIRKAEGWSQNGTYLHETGGISPDQSSYAFEPQPDGSTAGVLEGVQACIWTDPSWNHEDMNNQLFPRLYAVGETGWSVAENRDWARFRHISPVLPFH